MSTVRAGWAPWLMERCGLHSGDSLCVVEEVDSAGRTVGAVGFDNWTPNACRMHVALERPRACRKLVRAAFEYPFVQCDREVVLAEIREGNDRSLRLAKHLGFQEVLRVADGWERNEALVFFEMRRADCRWLQRQRKAA